MRQHYDKRGLALNAARLRMATLPATAEVLAFYTAKNARIILSYGVRVKPNTLKP